MQVKSYWHSKLQDFRLCPTYYKNKHVNGDTTVVKSMDLEYGSAIHLALNDILIGGNGLDIFEIYWASVSSDLPKSRLGKEELHEVGLEHLRKFKKMHQHHFKPVFMEERLFMKLPAYELEGTPDFVGQYKDILSIVDFKTAGYRYDKNKIICEEQLSLYSSLVIHNLKITPIQKVYVVFIKDPKAPSIQIIKKELTSNDIASTLENINRVIHNINQCDKTGYYKDTSNCIRGKLVCPYLNKCFGKIE